MPKVRELSIYEEFTKGNIEAQYTEGVSNKEIARRLGISEGSVRFNLRKLHLRGSMSNRRRSGRPRRTTQHEDRLLIRSRLANRFHTARDLRANFNQLTGKRLSLSTIKSRLYKDGNLRGCVAKKKPKLQPRHIAAQFQFARQHIDSGAVGSSYLVGRI
ncbi:uncharacterized protein LOC102803088 [Saccoglossus kowalevskii]|uniref:Uncharacterized protein LOC102803088 n=1 Tax=Saccoglossus kowalevskii TaxID=10224 RepID=A0ABM0MUX1_SACKO|nr:PREDICTED: uncharacterized protein LOC102803088 [Saccoglossus kowalevskii]